MLYRNDDAAAIAAMERARTGNYGDNAGTAGGFGATGIAGGIGTRSRYDGCGEFGRYDLYSEFGVQMCPCCGMESPELFYMNDDDECVGCSSCVSPSEVLF